MERVALGAASALAVCWCAMPVGASTIIATYTGMMGEAFADDPFLGGGNTAGGVSRFNGDPGVSQPYDLLSSFGANSPLLSIDLAIDWRSNAFTRWADGDVLGYEVDRLRQAAAAMGKSDPDPPAPAQATP